MRLVLILTFACLTGCQPAPPPAAALKPAPDPTQQSWYDAETAQLQTFGRNAADLLDRGKFDDAAAIVAQAQPLSDHLLGAPRPTLAATEAASDLDDVYGRVLIHQNRYGWARMTFQKNATRWKAWKPRTPESEQRMQAALARVAECDRKLSE